MTDNQKTKAFTVYPNITFDVEAIDHDEAEEKAHQRIRKMGVWNYDFTIEEGKEE